MENVCEKIARFREHVLDRQLRIAQILGYSYRRNEGELSESAYVILAIGLMYFEMIQQFYEGKSSKGKSEAFFRKGFRRVYPSTATLSDDGVDKLYEMIRCGMFHSAMPKFQISLDRRLNTAFDESQACLAINPAALIDDLIRHFLAYWEILWCGTDCDLRKNFLVYFNTFKGDDCVTISSMGTPAPWDMNNQTSHG